LLAKNGLHTSAMGVLRLQYEAVVRAVWVLYAASDIAINKLVAPLTPETERAAKNGLPGSSTMLSEIEKKGPPGVHRLLNEFKDYSSQALNSFIHSGIHAVNRHLSGYPAILFSTAIRQSNNLTHMSAIAIACLLENPGLVTSLGKIGNKYADCLQLK